MPRVKKPPRFLDLQTYRPLPKGGAQSHAFAEEFEPRQLLAMNMWD